MSQPNSMCPISGSRKCLPSSMMMPDTASTTNEIAMVQWTMRSSGVKRSIMRPVRGSRSGMVPRHR
ncbi:hypothetical protein D3C81_1959570 [compost metagenome]